MNLSLTLKIAVLISIFLCIKVHAEELSPPMVIDLYRSKQITVQDITTQLGPELQQFAKAMPNPAQLGEQQDGHEMVEWLMKITQGINKMGRFSYVSVSPIFYPGDKHIYMTIDVVDKEDKARMLSYLPKPTGSYHDPDQLIKNWMEYEKLGFSIGFKEGIAYKTCPAYHCIFGFDQPELQKYKGIFNTLVPRDQNQLTTILRKDKDENKRAAAAFLLAHMKDGHALIRILTPAMRDSSSAVRNNVMRVLAATLEKVKESGIPIEEVLREADAPNLTDRNKALYMMTALVDQPQYSDYIAEHSGDLLMAELKMTQPNVHSLAYDILTKISGLKLGERNYTAWEKWLKEHNYARK